MNFLQKMSQKVFGRPPQLFISMDKVDDAVPGQWQEKEKISSKQLPDRIFELLLKNEIKMNMIVVKKKEDFSFRSFCKSHLQFDYELCNVDQVEAGTIAFRRGDIIYIFKKFGRLYEAHVYERR